MNRFLLLIFVFATIVHADLNKLTGQPQFTIALDSYATHLYKGGVAGEISRPNEQSPAGVAGLGWEFGTPYISVDHKYTVDINDDNWYFNAVCGNVEGKQVETAGGKHCSYFLKDHLISLCPVDRIRS